VPKVSVLNPNETTRSWQTAKREAAVQLYLSGVEGDSAELVAARVAGFPISLNIIPVTDWIDPEEISAAAAAVVQVDPTRPRRSSASRSCPSGHDAADRRGLRPPLALVASLSVRRPRRRSASAQHRGPRDLAGAGRRRDRQPSELRRRATPSWSA
jgi:hypothetical protein